jgi:SAM-dependent methyltransferase
MQRIDTIADDTMAALESLESRLHERVNEVSNALVRLEPRSQSLEARLRTTEDVVTGLEGILGRISKPTQLPIMENAERRQDADKSQISLPDYSYLLLENRFRGSEEEIARRMAGYVSIFSSVPGKVLEIGPGRGELLTQFLASGIDASGIDTDEAMVELCQEKSLPVQLGNGLLYLQSLPDSSLGGIVAIQVIEHLPIQVRQQLMELAYAKLAAGGRLVLETINPKSLVALSSNYFRDPTHIWPEHPDTMAYTMELAGLRVRATEYLSPVPQEALLPSLPIEPFLPPRWAVMVQRMNESMARLNELLFGFQDYRIIAEKPLPKEC